MREPDATDAVDGEEDLFALEQHPDSEPDQARKTLHFIRSVPLEESEQSRRAEHLLRQVTLDSGLANLRRSETLLHDEIERLETGEVSLSTAHYHGARLQREFKAWLSAFRAFDDRTCAWLSHQFGKESAALVEFKRLLSHEFDTNFGYRLCCALRNASEHQGDVINDVNFHASQDPDTGEQETSVSIRFDGPKLTERFPKIRRATRNELQGCERPLELEWVVGAVTLSCQQIHAGLFLALWPEIQSAIEVIERHHQEAVEVGGWAVFTERHAFVGLAEAPGNVTFRYNAYNLADLARRNHAQVHRNSAEYASVSNGPRLHGMNPASMASENCSGPFTSWA